MGIINTIYRILCLFITENLQFFVLYTLYITKFSNLKQLRIGVKSLSMRESKEEGGGWYDTHSVSIFLTNNIEQTLHVMRYVISF